MPKDVAYIADHLRRVLVNGASAPHTAEVQYFFKDEIQSRGWYTHEIRKLARRFTKVIKQDAGLEYLVEVADNLFHGNVLEEKVLAVFLLEKSVVEFNDKHFKLFESWLSRVSTWADHDALVSFIIGYLLRDEPRRAKAVFKWAASRDRWHRRAAAVALIRGAREEMFFSEIVRITKLLLNDQDDMVQKGLGWLLRESAKYNPDPTIPFLRKIAPLAPRLVLRTACETVPPATRKEILGIERKNR